MGSGALTDRTQSTSAAAAADNHDAGTIESDDAHVTIDKRPTNTTLPLPETGQLPSPDISAEHLPQKNYHGGHHSPSRLAWSEGWRPPGAQSTFIR